MNKAMNSVNPNFFRLSCVTAILVFLGLTSAYAANTTYAWNKTTSGSYSWATAGNWTVIAGTGSTYPSASGDVALFQSGTGTYTVSAVPSVTIGSLQTQSSFSGTITLTGSTTTLTLAGASGGVGLSHAAGTINIGTGLTVDLTSTSALNVISASRTFNISASTGQFKMSGSGTLLVSGTLSNGGSGTYDPGAGTGTITYSGTGSPSVLAPSSGKKFYNLQIGSSPNTPSATLGGNITIGNQLNLSTGTLSLSSFTATFETGNNTPIIRNTGKLTTSTSGSLVIGTSTNMGGAAFTLPSDMFSADPAPLNNLTINRTNTLTMGNQDINVNGTLTLTAGAFAVGANTLGFSTGSTPIARTSGTITTTTSSGITFGVTSTSGAAFTIPNSTFTSTPADIGTFTINRTNNLTLGNQDLNIATSLVLTAGRIVLGAQNIFLGNNATVTGSPSATSHVVATSTGQFRKQFKAGTGLFTYPIGDGTNYSPIAFNFSFATYGTGTSYIGANVTASKYASVTTGNYINRYWTVTNSGGVSSTMSYAMQANYVVGDVQLPLYESTLNSQQWVGGSLANTMAPVNTTSHYLSTSSNLTSFPGTAIYTASHPGCAAPLNSNTHGPGSTFAAYTIGGSTPDYATFTDAAAALTICGINGPVVFDVRTGTYSELMSLGAITGSSSTNTITFKAETGVAANVTLTNSTGATLTLNGTSYISFKDLTIVNSNASTGVTGNYAVDIQGTTNNLLFDRCVLSKAYSSGSNTGHAVINDNNSTPTTLIQSNISVLYCDISGGGQGVFINSPNTTTRWTGMNVTGNTFSNGIRCIDLEDMAAVEVDSNTITGSSTSMDNYIYLSNCDGNNIVTNNIITVNQTGTSQTAIEITGCAGNNMVSGNTITMTAAGTMTPAIELTSNSNGAHIITKNKISSTTGYITYGISISASSGGSSGSPALIANNMVQTTGAISTGTNAGINISVPYVNIYFNSINVTATANLTNAGSSQGCILLASGSSNIGVINNILNHKGTGATAVGIYEASAGLITAISNNDYFTASGNAGRIGTTNYTYSAWIAPGVINETGSLNVDPQFNSNTDLHLDQNQPALLNGAAATGTGVTDDFDGDIRAGSPDIGADEFVGNAVLADFSASATAVCAGSTVTFTDLSTNTPTSWTWTVTPLGSGTFTYVGGTSSTSQNPQIQFNGSGNFTISLNASNGSTSDVETKTAYIGIALSGTYTIGGSSPDYANFVAAVNDLNSFGICGPVIFDVRSGTYTETFTINQVTGSSSTNTITFRPETGATVTLTNSVSGANAATVTLDGSDYVTFEGRQGGSGTAYSFTIINSSTSAAAIQFINDATNDNLQYCNIQGSFSGATGGLVEIGTSATGSTGNDNILIDHNKIGNSSALIGAGIFSQGTSGITNSNNTITNNEIFNTGNASAGTTYGVYVSATGNGGNWNISSNSFYHSSATAPSSPEYGIYFIPGSSANNNVIRYNYIGGKAAQCGGSAWAPGSVYLGAIYVNAGTTTGTNLIADNTIQNINSTGASIYGIQVYGGSAIIRSNLIGHPTTANSVTSSGGTSASAITIQGIWCNSINFPTVIDSNTIANVSATSTSNNLYGISHFGTGGSSTVTNNNLINILSNCSFSSQVLRGIYVAVNSVAGNNISNNVISNLGNTDNQNVITDVYGIWVAGSSAGGTISKNKITQIYQRQPGTLSGLYISGSGSYEVSNNVVETDNNGYTKATFIYAIRDAVSSGTLNFYYNTSVIAGATTDNSFAYIRSGSPTTNLRNNIFINAGTSASGFHYALYVSSATGFNSDYNFFATAFPANLAYWTSGAVTFSQYKTNSGQDNNSSSATTSSSTSSSTLVNLSELFTDYANGDLSIGGNSFAQNFISNNGTVVSVTDDITGTLRGTGTPNPDRGAYEFIACTPPVISGNTPTGPTTCSGSNGTIVLTGLNASTSYTVNYNKGGVAQSSATISSNGSGNLTITGLTAGTYDNIVVTLGGCSSLPYPTSPTVITLSDPTPPAVTSNTPTNPTTCSGTNGSIALGGLVPNTTFTVTYNKNSSPVGSASFSSNPSGVLTVTGLTAGSYDNFVVTVNNCSSTAYPSSGVITLTDPTPPSIASNGSSNPTTCSGSNGSVSLSGLTASTTYSVTYDKNGTPVAAANFTSNGGGVITIGSLTAGSYDNFVVTINNCSSPAYPSSGVISLTDPTPPSVSSNSETDPTACSGSNGSITLNGLGASLTYSVSYDKNGTPVSASNFSSNGAGVSVITGLTAGSYDNIVLTVINCTSSPYPAAGVITLTDPTPPAVTSHGSSNPTTCAGSNGSITLNGLAASTTYSISYNRNSTPVSAANFTSNGAGVVTISGLTAGTYNNFVLTVNSCTSPAYPASGVITISDPTTPTITTGTNPTICTGVTVANITYSATTGSPNQYSITWGPAAITAGFTNVSNATLTSSPIVVSVPSTAAANTYSGTLTVRNTTTGCVSGNNTISVITQSCSTSDATWTGPAGGSWHNASNWDINAVPNSCAVNVFINAGGSPIISSNDIQVGNMNIASGASITLAGKNLNVCGKWTGGGSASSAAIIGSGTTFINSTDSAQVMTGYTKFDILQINNSRGVSITGGGKVSISGGLHLQSGVLTVSSGTSLRLLSTSASNNSYIDDFSSGFSGSISGNVSADRFFPVSGYNQHFITAPVSTPALSQIGASGPDGSFVVPTADCDETRSSASSPYGSVFTYVDGHQANGACMLGNWRVTSAGNMVNGKGYSTYVFGSTTKTVTGPPNTGSISVGGLNNSGYASVFTKQGQLIESGWNLVGNPYPSAIDMTVSRTGDGFQNQVQIWVTSGPFSGSWQPDVIDGTPGHLIIPPFQGFMVRTIPASTGTHSYTFSQGERTRDVNVQFYRTASVNALKLNVDYNGIKDVTKIAFNPSATVDFDDEYDANKTNGAAGRPTLYTNSNSPTWYAINTLPLLTEATAVPVGLRPEVNGTMSISASGIETFDPTTYILLEDKLTGQWHNLRDGDYTFTTKATDDQHRFVLHFTPAARILTTDASCEASGTISVEQPGTANWNYAVTDNNATVIASGVLNATTPVTVNATPGTYTLNLADANGYTVVKSIEIGGTQSITASFNTNVSTAQVQDNINFTSTVNAIDYNWNFGDGSTASGATTSHSYTAEGVYNVTLMVTNASGCISTTTRSVTVTSRSITGIDNLANQKINIWSHDNRVYVDFGKQGKVEAQIDIYNVLGQQISSEKFGKNAIYSREINNLEASYVIIKVNNDNQVITRKLFIANNK